MNTKLLNKNDIKTAALRFAEFDDAWETKKLNNLARIYDGTHQTPDYVKEGIPFYSVEHVTSNDFSHTKFISESVFNNELKRVQIEKGDILMTRIGDIGTVRLIDWEVKASFYVSLALIKQSEKIDPVFLCQYMKTENFQKELWKRTIHVAFPKKINLGEIGECNVSFPSLPEQQKIALFLESVDRYIDSLRIQRKLLQKYKKGTMQKIFAQEIRFKDENGKNFPEWKKRKLNEILVERNENAPKSDKYPLMAFMAYKGVAPKGERYDREFLVNDSDNKNYKRTEYGDFIYSSNNLETGSIGLNRYGSASISPVYSIFKIHELCDYQFINSYFTRKSFINKMIRYRQGVMYGQWKIHESDFLKIEEKIPSIKEQQKIAGFLGLLDELINTKIGLITKTEQWKKGLMQKLFI